jgi:hypothetical protein
LEILRMWDKCFRRSGAFDHHRDPRPALFMSWLVHERKEVG